MDGFLQPPIFKFSGLKNTKSTIKSKLYKDPSVKQAALKDQIKSNEFMKLVLNSVQQIFIGGGTVLSENCAHCCFKGVLV